MTRLVGPMLLVGAVFVLTMAGWSPPAHATSSPPSTVPSTPTSAAPATVPSAPLVGLGQALYTVECQTCHEADGSGQLSQGVPSLHGVGAATVDFYLATGRMPEANLTRQAQRKPVSVSPGDRAALIAYITTTWPGGPAIPVIGGTDDLSDGGDLFRTNCSACHGAVGEGAALAYGAFAPSLRVATPLEVAEAVRSGPGNMPVFDPTEISQTQLDEVVAYVEYLHHPDDHGGLGLGHVGPIAEGLVGLLIGLAGAVGIAAYVGHRSDTEPEPVP